tara:strand:- start:13731 stop:14303 length:573 start_codon:yes stop_codon:yes gene_type:complete
MHDNYIEDQTFKGIDFSETTLLKGEYDNCTFINCELSNVNLLGFQFLECEFIACNLSSANLSETGFQNVVFKDCKMLGLLFETCNPFGFSVRFNDCQLDHASFYQTKLNNTVFTNCKFNHADFSASNLTAAHFENCDFLHAKFENTILEKADFRSSFNYSIHPETNKIKGAKFLLKDVVGLLDAYHIKID